MHNGIRLKNKRQNHIVIYRKLKIFLLVTSFVVATTLMTFANAHEMWIEPIRFSVKPGEKIYANEKVGQNFKGNSYSYLASSFEQFDITEAGKTRPIQSRLGDKPSVHETVTTDGLVILSAISTPSELVYETREKFDFFIKSEKLDWVFDAHKKRGLPEKGFKEVYRRYPKSLVKVGNGNGDDQVLGLPFEWVVETNPYTTNANIKARLFWQGEPLANYYVSVFNKVYETKDPDSKVFQLTDPKIKEMIKTELRTDEDGRVEIPRGNGGVFLINAVKMIEPGEDAAEKTGAVWESLWASATYEIVSN